jgi:hypothetical protein
MFHRAFELYVLVHGDMYTDDCASAVYKSANACAYAVYTTPSFSTPREMHAIMPTAYNHGEPGVIIGYS